jgi:hypothetical protein
MENHKLIVVGDIHLQTKEPKKSQCLDFLSWLFNQDFNNENNSLLFLGDLCEINSPYELYEVYVDYFVNRSKFEQIFILQGNHDCANISTVLSLFRPLPRVKVITNWEIIKFYNCNLIMLPHFNHEGTDKVSMIELYSNLYKTVTEEFDYGFGHIEDDTQNFSRHYPSTKNLKVKQWMNGHVHTPTIQNGGNYLGSATLNSSTEHGNTKYLAIIDGETKEFELKEIPKFMEYYTVEYPNKHEKPKTKYATFTVKGVLDKNVALEEYSKQAKEMGFEFYTNKILKQRVTEVEIDDVEKLEKPTFEKFAKTVGLSNEVFDICNEVIRLKSEE